MTIGHHVVTEGWHHADDCVQHLCAVIEASDSPDDSHIRRYVVIRKRHSELLGDHFPAVHLAAVEADDESVVVEGGVLSVEEALRVTGVPTCAEDFLIFRGRAARAFIAGSARGQHVAVKSRGRTEVAGDVRAVA